MIYNNLLPLEYRKRASYEKLSRFFTLFHLYLGMIIISGVVLLLPSYFFLSFQEADTARQIELTQKSVESKRVQNAEQAMQKVNKKIDTLLAQQPAPVVEYLSILSSQMPPNVTLTSFAFSKEKQTLDLVGKATRRDDFLEFLSRLKKEPKFLAVESPISNILKDTDLQFTLSITLGKPKTAPARPPRNR